MVEGFASRANSPSMGQPPLAQPGLTNQADFDGVTQTRIRDRIERRYRSVKPGLVAPTQDDRFKLIVSRRGLLCMDTGAIDALSAEDNFANHGLANLPI